MLEAVMGRVWAGVVQRATAKCIQRSVCGKNDTRVKRRTKQRSRLGLQWEPVWAAMDRSAPDRVRQASESYAAPLEDARAGRYLQVALGTARMGGGGGGSRAGASFSLSRAAPRRGEECNGSDGCPL